MTRLASIPTALVLVATLANAQGTKFYGEDNDGSEVKRATNVNSKTQEDLFKSHLINVETETFESFAGGTWANLTLPFNGGVFSATLAGLGVVTDLGSVTTNGSGRYPISGNKYFETAVKITDFFSVQFDQAVAAFGFYGVDLGDFGADLTLEFFLGGNLVESWKAYNASPTVCPNKYCGSIKYFGYINADTFDEVRFVRSGGQTVVDAFAFDDMTVGLLSQINPNPPGTVVPEPATLLLLGVGLGAVGIVRRRRHV